VTADPDPWIRAVRSSHDRLAAVVAARRAPIDGPSACSEWTVAQVLSHVGSGAQIFDLFLTAGLKGQEAPTSEAFGPIWESWNAKDPAQQVDDALVADAAFVERLEGLSAAERAAFALDLFGMQLDLAGLLRMRLGEAALHTWDVEVAGDPSATVSAEAVDLLVDGLPQLVARAGQPQEGVTPVTLVTSGPSRAFLLVPSAVRLEPLDPGDSIEPPTVRLPAEALLRLVYGRLDADHPAHGEVRGDGASVADLLVLFPGF
jgi:uncharacterized protein (TIGR03083 family)